MGAARQWLGSIIFTIYLFVSIPFYSLIVFACAFASLKARYFGILLWIDTTLYLLRILCRLDYAVEGYENLPKQARS